MMGMTYGDIAENPSVEYVHIVYLCVTWIMLEIRRKSVYE